MNSNELDIIAIIVEDYNTNLECAEYIHKAYSFYQYLMPKNYQVADLVEFLQWSSLHYAGWEKNENIARQIVCDCLCCCNDDLKKNYLLMNFNHSISKFNPCDVNKMANFYNYVSNFKLPNTFILQPENYYKHFINNKTKESLVKNEIKNK